MKKTLVLGTATAAIALTLGAGLTGCTRRQIIETLYGTPTVDNPPTIREDPIEDVYGPPVDIDWNDDIEDLDIPGQPLPALYGPPPA